MATASGPNYFISPEEIAKRMGLCVRTVTRYLREGKIKGVKTSPKCWRVSEEEFQRFMRSK